MLYSYIKFKLYIAVQLVHKCQLVFLKQDLEKAFQATELFRQEYCKTKLLNKESVNQNPLFNWSDLVHIDE